MKAIRQNERETWSEGFAHGQVLSEVAGVCPYPRGSVEADAWMDGWYQGALKTDGLGYRDGPVTEPGTKLVWRDKPRPPGHARRDYAATACGGRCA